MSTLTVSIIVLIALVVGAVLVFNLWQTRGNRRLAKGEQDLRSSSFDPPLASFDRKRPDSGAQVEHWQHGADQNAWARQRREPTLTADDAAPTRRFAPDSFDASDHSPGWGDETFPMSSDDGEPDNEMNDDVGAPQFETPRLEPAVLGATGVAAARPDLPHSWAGRAAAAAVFESTQPLKSDSDVVEGGAAAPADAVDYVPADVEHVVTLIPRTPVNAERLIALSSSLRHVGSKAVRIEIDGGQGRWIPLQSGTMVGCLRCSVLLANRQGPLNAVELSDFSAALESIAGQIGARFVAPDMNQVLRQARELDAVAARLDTQVDLGVEASEPITSSGLAALARKLDLFDRGGGRFAGFGEGGELLYLLSAGASSDMLAFVLDVPRTGEAQDPWRSMVACASSCAQLVGGRVVDNAGRGMSVGMIESVAQQIHKRYQELADAGLKAGASQALRVFN